MAGALYYQASEEAVGGIFFCAERGMYLQAGRSCERCRRMSAGIIGQERSLQRARQKMISKLGKLYGKETTNA